MIKQSKPLSRFKDALALAITLAIAFLIFTLVTLVFPELETLGVMLMVVVVILGSLYSQTGSFKKTIAELSQKTVDLVRGIAISVIILSTIVLVLLLLFGVFNWISSLSATTIIIFLLLLLLLKK